MNKQIDKQIPELQTVHKGLNQVLNIEGETNLIGTLCFEASANGNEPLTRDFEIKMVVPESYPVDLPIVYEIGGKMNVNYEHVHKDGRLCLAVPIEERSKYLEQPSLLGFVNRLIVPYFYGYCCWENHGVHPFGEAEHGLKGIVRYYVDFLDLADESKVLGFIIHLYKYGYRGHHPCPCASGKIVRKCHQKKLFELHQSHTDTTLKLDLIAALEVIPVSAISPSDIKAILSILGKLAKLNI